MTLDIYTLFVCELYVLGFLSIILVFAWVGAQYDRVLGFTTLALTLTLMAVFLSSLRSAGFVFLPIAVGNVVMLLAYGNLLNAFRAFCNKPLGFSWLAGALLWAILCTFPQFYASQPKRVLVLCLLCIIYTGALIRLLWQSRDALQVTFWPAQMLLWIHLLFHVARIFLDDAIATPVHGAIAGSSFSVYVILESILFVIGLTFTILAMVNERTQIAHKRASLHDPLTSVWNRRALFEQADRLVVRNTRSPQPLVYTAVLFDLDHFKGINDRYGHLQGDRVLIDFCHVVQALLPAGGHFARLGGEEFAAILPGNSEDAERVCERIRLATQLSQPNDVCYTVSIGYATAYHRDHTFPILLGLADEALYRAKASGRNRVERYFVQLQPMQEAALS
ncbi:GGDEF domain-containing protein [Pantoea rwandensis]|uniref:diguanylate cyclase n=1 Tax=Pantoea rwandensis TaxID=1076550 RepID=A0ABM5RIT1_9GAMM|nr:GGDEF domain-containing protein [Pantoea rwandensis]AIR85952.1 cellulose synthase [Pantoea rwandensis]HAU5562357.1 GGDEF domain-containing protein [Serratia fonticola]